MKIYTKKGDTGNTSLIGVNVSKTDPRIALNGTLDEANACIGIALSKMENSDLYTILSIMQNILFCIGSEIAVTYEKLDKSITISNEDVLYLENKIDLLEVNLPPLKNFILPGGTELAAQLHLARTIVRRAEREMVDVCKQFNYRQVLIAWLNRCSDCLFVIARTLNYRAGIKDVLWTEKW